MKIIVNKNGNILETASDFVFGAWEQLDQLLEGTIVHKWKALDTEGNTVGYLIDENETAMLGKVQPDYDVMIIDALPSDYTYDKYLYLNGEFVINPNYTEPAKTVEELTTENNALKVKIVEQELSQVETELEMDCRLSRVELGLV